jgi:putative two-component system response regulator
MGTDGLVPTRSRPWSSCKPAPAFAQEPWRGLSGEALPEGDGSCEKRDFWIDETEGILFALAQAVEQRDSQTAGHCERLAFMSVAMGMAMRLDRATLLTLYQGGYLHDVGKVGMPDSILFKPGSLSAEEWVTMRSHPARGEEICRHVVSLRPVLPLIRHHHERWDGSGYPDGLRAEQIPLEARLLQTADIYDALISPRPYKGPFSPPQALQILREETERGWRDPQVVDLFFRLHEKVIAKIAEFTTGADHNLRAMRASLDNLQEFLDSASASGTC